MTVKSHRRELARRLGIPVSILEQYLEQKKAESSESSESKAELQPMRRSRWVRRRSVE